MNPKQLKKAMSSLGYDQAELARQTGYSEAMVSRYVNGVKEIPEKFSVSVNNMLALCKNEV